MSISTLKEIALAKSASLFVGQSQNGEVSNKFFTLPGRLQSEIIDCISRIGLRIEPALAAILAASMQQFCFEDLTLSYPNFPIKEILAVRSTLPLSASLESLTLKNCEINEEFFNRLVLGYPQLRSLSLESCTLSEDAVIRLASALRENRFEQLSLSLTPLVGSQPSFLAEGCKKSTTLRKLAVNDCLDNEGWVTFCTHLKGHGAIQNLELQSNGIDESGMRAAAEMVKSESALLRFVLTYDLCKDAGSRLIAEALQENNRILELDLRSNAIKDENFQLFSLLNLQNNRVRLPDTAFSFSF